MGATNRVLRQTLPGLDGYSLRTVFMSLTLRSSCVPVILVVLGANRIAVGIPCAIPPVIGPRCHLGLCPLSPRPRAGTRRRGICFWMQRPTSLAIAGGVMVRIRPVSRFQMNAPTSIEATQWADPCEGGGLSCVCRLGWMGRIPPSAPFPRPGDGRGLLVCSVLLYLRP